MTYKETLHYLYNSMPVYQRSGASAYKPGLDTSVTLDNYLGNPHRAYRTIHVAGTNGKGSVSHLLAATLAAEGYRVGLYTSPHLVDFRERIRVNGEMIPESYVVEFVEKYKNIFEPLHPSFFELTSSLAFDYFRAAKVDYAIIEVGLGGRLDSTNIITPVLSIITNISLDHTQLLGDTIEKIASEKAGIIKPGIPAIIGEASTESLRNVFIEKAKEVKAPLYFAEDMEIIQSVTRSRDEKWNIDSVEFGKITDELRGEAQEYNARTVLAALHVLPYVLDIKFSRKAVRRAFSRVVELTGLMGRWQTLREHPYVVCDTGHNPGGWTFLELQLLREIQRKKLYMIVGMVNDKDIDGVLEYMPKGAFYLFTQASIQRALPAEELASKAGKHGLKGIVCPTVAEAVARALVLANWKDTIFIGGSTFIVAEAYPLFQSEQTLTTNS